jgi:hypothetical protein
LDRKNEPVIGRPIHRFPRLGSTVLVSVIVSVAVAVAVVVVVVQVGSGAGASGLARVAVSHGARRISFILTSITQWDHF